MTKEEYQGLEGEIVKEDIYRMRDVPDEVSVNDPTFVHWKGHYRAFNFTPDVIFDLGANVGIFTRYARSLYPGALIVAVEPDEKNIERFKKDTNLDDRRLRILEMAIGKGQIWKSVNAINGAHECYLSDSLSWRDDELAVSSVVDKSSVDSIMLSDLWDTYVNESDKVVLKLDIEGNEMVVFEHTASMDALKRADYIVMELHFNALLARDVESVRVRTLEMIMELSETHRVEYEHIYLYAIKKQWRSNIGQSSENS
jgi:FkbM family methyltransferase